MIRTLASAALCGASLLATAAAAQTAPSSVEAFTGAILADPLDAAVINARCDAYVAEANRRIDQLAAETGPATLDTTLQRFDDITALLGASSGEFGLYMQTGGDDARRQAGANCGVRLSEIGNKLSLSRPIYDRLKAVPLAGADAATRLYLGRTLAGFERAGVALPPEQRARAQALQDKLAAVGTAFDKAINDGQKKVTADPAELDGLPADFIAAHKPGADGKVTITTDYPDYVPVATYAKSEELRRRLYFAYMTRAYPGNDANLRQMLDLRQQLADLLGRKNYAALIAEDKMLDTPAKIEALLKEMGDAARPVGESDFRRKLAIWQKDHPGATSYGVWNNAYLTNLLKKQDYAYDTQESRQYFAYNDVRDGILKLTEDLFGVEIRPWKTTVWSPLVESYEMYEGGKLIGRFYFDSHPRPGKYGHANFIPLRIGVTGHQVPMGVLVMNLPAGDHTTGLMQHDDVETFLHEFGHGLHHIFGGQQQRWAGQSGVATEWDFVEAPSQMLEEWVYDYDTLKAFAHDASGKVIPPELVAKMNKARYFNLGMGDMQQLGYSNISLGLHTAPAPADLGAASRALYDAYSIQPIPPETQMQDSFNHLNGYSAIYYTYRWSKVIADDMFTAFEKAGLRDRTTAMRYRMEVLAPGGTKPAAELVQKFLGRPISLDAYKADLAKDR